MSVKEWFKGKAPDVTPVTSACRKTFDASRDATVNVTRVVVTKARDMHEVLSDDHVRVAKNVTLNGALYVVRSYGGGPIIDIVSRSVDNGKVGSQRLKDLEDRVAKLEKELSSMKTSEQSKIPPRNTTSKSQNVLDQSNASADQRSENVLQNFKMHDFVGLIIPGDGKLKENLAPEKQMENPNDCTEDSSVGSQYRRSKL